MTEHRYTDPVLCYVIHDKNVACFTTRQLDKQWGDDWNDAPYQWNAGVPYDWYPWRDTDPWEITYVTFTPNLCRPEDHEKENEFGTGDWSVEEINRGDVPWLWLDGVQIYAGTTLTEFKRVIEAMGGTVGEWEGGEDGG